MPETVQRPQCLARDPVQVVVAEAQILQVFCKGVKTAIVVFYILKKPKKGLPLTFQSLEGVLIDVGDRVALQLERVEQYQVAEDAGRNLGQLVVGQNQRVQILQTC